MPTSSQLTQRIGIDRLSNLMNLYTKTGCPWCAEAKRWLDAKGYQYNEIDVRAQPERMEEMKAVSGQTYAPTLVVGTLVLPDFDTDQLAEFLHQHEIQP